MLSVDFHKLNNAFNFKLLFSDCFFYLDRLLFVFERLKLQPAIYKQRLQISVIRYPLFSNVTHIIASTQIL